jgi:penicillin-binding protein 1B
MRTTIRARVGRHRLAATLLGGSLLGLLAVAGWAWHTVAGIDLNRPHDAAVVYTAGQRIVPGLALDAVDLLGTLRRLGYREISGAPVAPGQFRRGGDRWEIVLQPRDDPGGARGALGVRLILDAGRIRSIATATGGLLDEVELEPEVLTGLGEAGGRLHRPVALAQLPPHVAQAVLAAEDHRFLDHPGVDARAVLRASWINLRRAAVAQGASTLTQQLVKNTLLSPRRTVGRKVREAILALALERRYSKADILEAYLNGIYLGQHGTLAIQGVGAAARSYFGKEADRLTLGEAALLAGLIRAPNSYSPFQHPDRARERRDAVLRRMRALGWIDEPAWKAATREGVRIARSPSPPLRAPYFVDTVRAQVEQAATDGPLAPAGLRIYTTLDPILQRAAEIAVVRGLDRLESQVPRLRRRDPAARLQAALVALDARTGEIRALVGGRDYGVSQFNRVTQARRQPGSAFKPFVYLAALGAGPRGEPPHLTAASLVEDRPLTVQTGRDAWSPRNYENRFEGTVPVRRALEQSLNAATVWIAETVGIEAVVQAARRAGFTSELAAVPALSLGSFEVTPLELAAAYAPFANGGDRVTATVLRAVADREGSVIERTRAVPVPTIAPEEAFLLTHLLAGVIDHGTGAPARLLGIQGPVAGKTGTTNEGRDAWFVGYTPRLIVLVWVGFDERDVMRLSGAQAALPIWADFMRVALQVVPGEAFTPPASVVFRDVDPTNGKLATTWCPLAIREAFLAGSEPREPCPDHGPSEFFRSFIRRLFG